VARRSPRRLSQIWPLVTVSTMASAEPSGESASGPAAVDATSSGPKATYRQVVALRESRSRHAHAAPPSASNARTHGTTARTRARTVASRLALAGSRAAGVTTVVAPGRASASENCAAVPNRSAGSLESAVTTAASTCGGTVLRCSVIERGSSVITRAMMACAVGPVNGGSPVSISYSTQPSA